MKKHKLLKKFFSLLVAFVMVFGVFLFFEIPQVFAATSQEAGNVGELQTAITAFNNGNTDMTIIITNDIPINTTNVALPPIANNSGRTLTIRSDTDNTHTLTFTSIYIHNFSGNPYFQINNGTLELENITVLGYNQAPTDAPIVTVNSGGTLIMNAGATLTKNDSRSPGAGVLVNSGGKFTMEGGTISDNKVVESGGGGGVYIDGGTFTMNGGTISGNTSAGGGGGVNIINGGTFIMDGGTISGNKAGTGGDFSGGGVSVMEGSTFTMTGSIIRDNSTIEDGGGVYIKDSDITIGDKAIISGNTAGRDGGGIIKIDTGVITIGGNAHISGNKAGRDGGGALIDSTGDIIIGGSAVINGNSLTNGAADNLTLLGADTFITLGTSGNTPRSGMRVGVRKILDVDETLDASVNVIVGSGASGTQAQYFFADAPGYTVIYDRNFHNFENVLRIAPAPKPINGGSDIVETRSITYNANGGSGSMATGHVVKGESYTLRANAFTRPGHKFVGWNTAANGSGTEFADGAAIEIVNNNITLYAQWWNPVNSPVSIWSGRGDVTVTIDIDHTRFVRLVLDEGVVDDNNYTVAAGSTVLTLKRNYLRTLASDTYTFFAEFTDIIAMFTVTVDIDIEAVATNIDVGDETPDIDVEDETPDIDVGDETPDIDVEDETPDIDVDDETPDIDVGDETPDIDDGDETPGTHVPETDDDSNTRIWVVLLLIAVLGVLAVIIVWVLKSRKTV